MRVGLGNAIEHGGDRAQALDVGLHIAADLELEPAMTVARDHFLERLRRPSFTGFWFPLR